MSKTRYNRSSRLFVLLLTGFFAIFIFLTFLTFFTALTATKGWISSGDGQNFLLTVEPAEVHAGQEMRGERPLAFEFKVPTRLRGGGMPARLYQGNDPDPSILQIELPILLNLFDADEDESGSIGVVGFEPSRFCRIFHKNCRAKTESGYWKATLIEKNGRRHEMQMAVAMRDQVYNMPYPHILGVYLREWQFLNPGDRVRLEYHGHVPGRATDWTDRPFFAHFRYRSFVPGQDGALKPGPWTMLTDEQVQPLEILALNEAAFVRTIFPLDIQAGAPFTLAVVATDRYGNPAKISGTVRLSGDITDQLTFDNEWRREKTLLFPQPGDYRIIAEFPGARPVYHYSRIYPGTPPVERLLGDVHIHTGDGGAQRKFLGAFGPGDHAALSSTTTHALTYLEQVAGWIF